MEHVLLKCRQYRNLRRRIFDTMTFDIKAILNEPTQAAKATRFMEQTHLLGQFRSCVKAQRGEADHWGETEGTWTQDD